MPRNKTRKPKKPAGSVRKQSLDARNKKLRASWKQMLEFYRIREGDPKVTLVYNELLENYLLTLQVRNSKLSQSEMGDQAARIYQEAEKQVLVGEGNEKRISWDDISIALESVSFLPMLGRDSKDYVPMTVIATIPTSRLSDPEIAFIESYMDGKVDDTAGTMSLDGGMFELTRPITAARYANMQGMIKRKIMDRTVRLYNAEFNTSHAINVTLKEKITDLLLPYSV